MPYFIMKYGIWRMKYGYASEFLPTRLCDSKRRIWTSQSQMIIRKTSLGATDAASTDASASAVTSRPPGHGNRAFDGWTVQRIESYRGRVFDSRWRRIRVVIVEPTRTVFLIQVEWHKSSQMEEDVD